MDGGIRDGMKDIKIGFIGLGGRGYSLMRWVVLEQGEHVTAVCDVYEDRTKAGADAVEEAGCERPAEYLDYHDVIKDEKVNTIIIATAWESHVEIALAALYAGKAVAMEVGGAYTLKDCYRCGIPAAGMGNVTLPVLLPVKSFLFYLPAFPSDSCCFLRILSGDPDACQPLEFCPHALSIYDLFFPEPQHIHRFPIIIYIINEFSMPFRSLFWNLYSSVMLGMLPVL